MESVASADPQKEARKPKRAAAAGPAKRRGRPPGKRSNPDFEQVTIYLRRKTHKDAKVELLRGEERQEFSELVEDLVRKWLKC
jgi:hypothetical protein